MLFHVLFENAILMDMIVEHLLTLMEMENKIILSFGMI
jgi:hypothetical protein